MLNRVQCQRIISWFWLLTLWTASAFAQDSDVAARLLLLQEAQTAAGAGEHRRALELAQRAQALRSTPSLQSFIAQQQFALRQFADVIATATECLQTTTRDPTVPNRSSLLERCTQLQRDATQRTALLTVTVPAEIPAQAVVLINGRRLRSELFDTPYPVNPGTVVVETRQGSQVLSRRELQLDEAQRDRLRLDFSQQQQPSTGRVPALVLLGVGSAVMVSAAIPLALRFTSIPADCQLTGTVLECDRLPTGISPAGLNGLLGAGIVLATVGAGLTSTGAALFVRGNRAEQNRVVRVRPVLNGIAFEGAF